MTLMSIEKLCALFVICRTKCPVCSASPTFVIFIEIVSPLAIFVHASGMHLPGGIKL